MSSTIKSCFERKKRCFSVKSNYEEERKTAREGIFAYLLLLTFLLAYLAYLFLLTSNVVLDYVLSKLFSFTFI